MEKKEPIKIGNVYQVKVSGRWSPVKIERILSLGHYYGENLETKRMVTIKNPKNIGAQVRDCTCGHCEARNSFEAKSKNV